MKKMFFAAAFVALCLLAASVGAYHEQQQSGFRCTGLCFGWTPDGVGHGYSRDPYFGRQRNDYGGWVGGGWDDYYYNRYQPPPPPHYWQPQPPPHYWQPQQPNYWGRRR